MRRSLRVEVRIFHRVVATANVPEVEAAASSCNERQPLWGLAIVELIKFDYCSHRKKLAIALFILSWLL